MQRRSHELPIDKIFRAAAVEVTARLPFACMSIAIAGISLIHVIITIVGPHHTRVVHVGQVPPEAVAPVGNRRVVVGHILPVGHGDVGLDLAAGVFILDVVVFLAACESHGREEGNPYHAVCFHIFFCYVMIVRSTCATSVTYCFSFRAASRKIPCCVRNRSVPPRNSVRPGSRTREIPLSF